MSHPNDAQLVRFAVRTRILTPEAAEDVLFLAHKFRGRRKVAEIILARGYLDAAELDALRVAFRQGDPAFSGAHPRFGSASIDPGDFAEAPRTGAALAAGTAGEGTVVSPIPRTFAGLRSSPAARTIDEADEDEAVTIMDARLPPEVEQAIQRALGDDEGAATQAWVPKLTEPEPLEAFAKASPSAGGAPRRTEEEDALAALDLPGIKAGAPSSVGAADLEPEEGEESAGLVQRVASDSALTDPPAYELRAPTHPSLGGYRLDGLVAKGSRATVYRATDLSRERTVALRVFKGDPDKVARVLASAGPRLVAAARLNHPALVRIVDLGQAEDRHFIALEFVAGLTLEEHLSAEGPLPKLAAFELGRDVARGLAAIHAAGEVHDDLRPDRVFLGADGRTRLSGLGLPSVAPLELGEGIPALPAPERAWGAPSSPASDLYALGGLLYVALTGTLPFDPTDARALTEALDRTTGRLAESRPDVPEDVTRVIMALLDPSAERRPRSAGEVADVLARAAIREEGAEGRERSAGLRPDARRLLTRTVAGLGFLSMLLAGWVVLGSAPRGPSAAAGLCAGAMGCALLLTGALELVRQGQFPVTLGTLWIVRARDVIALGGSAGLIAGALASPAAGLDRLVAGVGALTGLLWCFGFGLRTAVAAARPDAGRGRTLAVLGDVRLRRWRLAAVPLATGACALAVLRWMMIVYFSTPSASSSSI